MRLPYFIARRYLFAKKSHNVINIISVISAIGIAVGSCALIIVLSIYNGFEEVVRGIYDRAVPDIEVTSSSQKYFRADTGGFLQIPSLPGVAVVSCTVEETVFLIYEGREATVLLKGVDSLYTTLPDLRSCIVRGDFNLMHGDVPHAVVGRGLSVEMGVLPRFLDPIEVYFPSRDREISLVNPAASLNKEVFYPTGVFFSGNENLSRVFFVDLEYARALVDVEPGVAGKVEIRLASGADQEAVMKGVQELLGEGFVVKDKYMQNEVVYRMMRIEKAVIFLILIFIIVVVACNVFGSLTMLIIEKRDDIRTLKYLGARDKVIKRVFLNEGMMIIVLGTVVGMVVGIALCLIQQYVGVIRMPGNFVVQYYPVVIRVSDILISFTGVILAGLLITLVPTNRNLSNL